MHPNFPYGSMDPFHGMHLQQQQHQPQQPRHPQQPHHPYPPVRPVLLTAKSVERCQYRSKFCRNHRAIKTNGTMHRFCEFHRYKANMNQKRWVQTQREAKRGQTPSSSGDESEYSQQADDGVDAAMATTGPKASLDDERLQHPNQYQSLDPRTLPPLPTPPSWRWDGSDRVHFAAEDVQPVIERVTSAPLRPHTEEDEELFSLLLHLDSSAAQSNQVDARAAPASTSSSFLAWAPHEGERFHHNQ
ncbi:hypothetical protein PINS_up003256 [Pythium insidiosum]|nr:hypothetical protein PINS_up003256 [Pythium insidiosum]